MTKIINTKKEQILASEQDKAFFFNAILSNIEPGEKLKQAANKYLDSKSIK